jgi:lipoyl(octanoyl) transferase
VQAARRTGAPGIYVTDAKIASLGLRVRRGRSFHGLAFNINMDLEPFQRINPCGYAGLQVTNLAHFVPADLAEVEQILVQQLASQLGFDEIRVATEGAWPHE